MFTFRRLFRRNEIKCIYFFLVENSSHALSAQLTPPTECVTKQMNMSENRTALPKGNGNIEKQVKCLRSRAGDERVVQAAAPTSLGQKLQMMEDKKIKKKHLLSCWVAWTQPYTQGHFVINQIWTWHRKAWCKHGRTDGDDGDDRDDRARAIDVARWRGQEIGLYLASLRW